MGKIFHLTFHHQGEFQSTCYAGGKEFVVNGIDEDTFSYTVVMEHVKDDLHYLEIGGIYCKDKLGDWKLVKNDSDLFKLVSEVQSCDHIDLYIDNILDYNVEPMKQMQPHVVIRPRHNLLAAKKLVKRKFVTTHQLQQQQKIKKTTEMGKTEIGSTKRLEQGGTRKSPRLNKLQQANDPIVSQKFPTAAKRKLDLQNPPHDDENMGENSFSTILPPPPPLTEYEKQRAIRVKLNNEHYLALNLPTLSAGLRNSKQKGKDNEKMCNGGDEDYDPGKEDGSEGDVSVTPPKKAKKVDNKKLLMGRGATTRSRANAASKKPATEEASKKEETCPPVQPAESAVPNIELPELPQPQPHDGNGSMAAFIAMRKRQQEQVAKEKAIQEVAAIASKRTVEERNLPENEEDIEEGGDQEVVVPKRLRGKTRMDNVHTRSLDKRIVIGMNECAQPIADNDKVLSKLSNFLGTLAKRCVPLTYVTWRHVPENLKKTMWNYCKARYIIPEELEKWVGQTIHALWKGYKSRIKAAHYTAYENDEQRLENRPDEIPVERFKMLLEYWNDESVQARAKKNSASRKLYVDTHTAGPKSFAQVRNKLKKKAPDQATPCDAEIFVKTRKRYDGREYKTDPKIMNTKIEKINDKLSVGDAVGELLSDGKSHGPTWLLGRCVKPSVGSSSNAPTDTYVQELTTKIRQSLADEVEEKVKQVQAEMDEQVNKKVKQNLALVLQKLAEANPNITVDLEDLCATVSSDKDDGTPMTGGSSI